MITLEELQKMDKNDLIAIIGNYISDQEIWIAKAEALEKEVDLQKAKIERLTGELNDTVSMNEMYIKEVEQNSGLQKQVDELKERLHMIFALGFDYDGCDKTESLKGLIDELVKITQMDSKEFAEYYKGE